MKLSRNESMKPCITYVIQPSAARQGGSDPILFFCCRFSARQVTPKHRAAVPGVARFMVDTCNKFLHGGNHEAQCFILVISQKGVTK